MNVKPNLDRKVTYETNISKIKWTRWLFFIKTEQQELVEDLVQIITVFSCKLQGKHGKRQ